MRPCFLVIDKPPGITSHDVVAAVRAVTGVKKVGHTGTLDPFATGVLPLALGAATRLIPFLDEKLKVYDATVTLGRSTTTGDPTGETVDEAPVPRLDETEVRRVLRGFVGERMQRPPAYSAVKVGGKRLYQYARAGRKVEAAPRPITIHEMELLHLDEGAFRVRIGCSRGTYARVLAEEIAAALGTVGHLSALARLRSGPFTMDEALGFPELAVMVSAEVGRSWREVLLPRRKGEPRVTWKHRDEVRRALEPYCLSPVRCLAHLPLVDVDADVERRVRSGWLPPATPAQAAVGQRYLVTRGDRVLAVAERRPEGGKILRTF